MLWFTYMKAQNVAFLLSFDKTGRNINGIKTIEMAFGDDLCLGEGTLLSGVILSVGRQSVFCCTDIHYYQGFRVERNSFEVKCDHIADMLALAAPVIIEGCRPDRAEINIDLVGTRCRGMAPTPAFTGPRGGALMNKIPINTVFTICCKFHVRHPPSSCCGWRHGPFEPPPEAVMRPPISARPWQQARQRPHSACQAPPPAAVQASAPRSS